jgi:hypothetical protein
MIERNAKKKEEPFGRNVRGQHGSKSDTSR